MTGERVRADLLTAGDVIRVDFDEGWYVVLGVFQEGRDGPMALDVEREDGRTAGEWHVGPEHQVERRRPASRP